VHDDEEVLFALLDLDIEEVGGINEWATLSSNAPETYLACPYTAAIGVERTRFFQKTRSYIPQPFTDYHGLFVPNDVEHRMLEVAGLSRHHIVGRGVKLGADAFKVITD
jgi:hypothetical protein